MSADARGFISDFEAVLPVDEALFPVLTGSYRRLPPPPRLLSLGEYETLRRRLDDLRFRELPSELSSDELPVDEDEYFRFRRICSLEDLLLGLRDLRPPLRLRRLDGGEGERDEALWARPLPF